GSYTVCFYFFFSSRRRHTRFSRDWSSDVCSSDLTELCGSFLCEKKMSKKLLALSMVAFSGASLVYATTMTRQEYNDYRGWQLPRSEERRVGKEGSARVRREHGKKRRQTVEV